MTTETIVAKTREEAAQLVTELERRQKSAKDFVVRGPNVQVVVEDVPVGPAGPDGDQPYGTVARLRLPDVGSFDLSNTAHSQLADRLGVPKAYWDRCQSLAPGLLATNANHWLGRDDSPALYRTLDGRIRAVLSDKYRVIDHFDLFFNVFQVARSVGAEIQRVTLTDDRFEARLIVNDWRETVNYNPDPKAHTIHTVGELVPGLYVKNSETGRGGLEVAPFVLDRICANGYVVENKLRRIHLGSRLEEGAWISSETQRKKNEVLFAEVSDLCKAVFDREQFKTLVERFAEGATLKLADPQAAVEAIVAKDTSITEADREAILKELLAPSDGDRGGLSLFALASAVTRVAQNVEDVEKQTALEQLGAGVLLGKARELVAVR